MGYYTDTQADDYTIKMFNSLFGRDPAQAGLDYWSDFLMTKDSPFGESDFSDLLVSGASGSDLDYYNKKLINEDFNGLFNRDAAEAGLDYYNNALKDPTSGVNYSNLARTILNGAQGDDLTAYNTKLNGGSSGTSAGTDDGTSAGAGVGRSDGTSATDDATDDATEVTVPSVSNENASTWLNDLSGTIDNYFNSYTQYADLANQIDNWMQNSINRQRMTSDQVTSTINQIANQRAGSGIMGGTEATNLNATVLSELAKVFEDNQANIELAGNEMKANAISGLSDNALSAIDALLNMYSINAEDQQNWASIAANLLTQGY